MSGHVRAEANVLITNNNTPDMVQVSPCPDTAARRYVFRTLGGKGETPFRGVPLPTSGIRPKSFGLSGAGEFWR